MQIQMGYSTYILYTILFILYYITLYILRRDGVYNWMCNVYFLFIFAYSFFFFFFFISHRIYLCECVLLLMSMSAAVVFVAFASWRLAIDFLSQVSKLWHF